MNHPSVYETTTVFLEMLQEKLERAEAERRRKSDQKCGTSYCFLTRYFRNRHYKLLVLKRSENSRKFGHFNITIHDHEEKSKLEIENTGKQFDNMSALVRFYQSEEITRDFTCIGGYLDNERDEIVQVSQILIAQVATIMFSCN